MFKKKGLYKSSDRLRCFTFWAYLTKHCTCLAVKQTRFCNSTEPQKSYIYYRNCWIKLIWKISSNDISPISNIVFSQYSQTKKFNSYLGWEQDDVKYLNDNTTASNAHEGRKEKYLGLTVYQLNMTIEDYDWVQWLQWYPMPFPVGPDSMHHIVLIHKSRAFER